MVQANFPIILREKRGQITGVNELGEHVRAAGREIPLLADVTYGTSAETETETVFFPSGSPTFSVVNSALLDPVNETTWEVLYDRRVWNIQELRPYTTEGALTPLNRVKIRCERER